MTEIQWLEPALAESREYTWPGKLLPGFARMRQQACFSNAQQLVLSRYSDLRYVEGTGWKEGMLYPVHHAWIINEDDQVIDATWTNRKQAPRVYRGAIVVNYPQLRDHVLENMRYDPFLCCMHDMCICLGLLDDE